jgi:urease accessory protein
MNSAQLLRVLQLTDSLFPVGSFAYSDGLEAAATNGFIRDAGSLHTWLEHYVHSVFVPCDGLALLKSLRAAACVDWATIRMIDEELTALKPAAAARAASQSVGKRLVAAYPAVSQDVSLDKELQLTYWNAAVAYGIVFSRLGIDRRDALLGFGYARLAGMISAGMRVMALGQQKGQELLTSLLAELPEATDRILESEESPLRCFSPRMDIQQMNHRYLYSRLFRS